MKIHFEITPKFSEKDPHILIQAAQLTDQAREVMDYLEQFSTVNQVVIPIRTDDQLVMVKIEEIIMTDIDKNVLTIYTVDGLYMTKETLINFQNRVNRRNFLQISRHAIINIDHLESLSDSFSGNMMAKLTRGIKSSVSRKYVKSLMDYLGL
jgi:transcriptional regulator